MKRIPGISGTLALTLLSVAELASSARCQEQLAKLLTPEVGAQDKFGSAIAVSGNTALIGALNDTTSGVTAGAVWVFEWHGPVWVHQQVLTSSDAAAHDLFGVSVSLSSDVAIVAASGDDHGGLSGAGAAYIYRRAGGRWLEEQKLIASDGANDDFYGRVAIDGDLAVVGAMLEDHDGLKDSGAAYVYRRTPSGWVEEQKLTAPDGTKNAFFGYCVAVDGDLVAVGSPQANGTPFVAGAVYVYRWNTVSWELDQTLSAEGGSISYGFASAIAFEGDFAVIGAPSWSFVLGGMSNVYIFRRSAGIWAQEAELPSGPLTLLDGFGYSVALSGETALVGDYDNDDWKGACHVFRRVDSNWQLVQTLKAGDSDNNNQFGGEVSLSGDFAMVSAPADEQQGAGSGSAYAFALNWDDLGSGLAGAAGEPALLGVGSLAAGQRVWLSVSNALPLASTIVIFGASQVDLPFKGGVLVPAPDRVLLGLQLDAEGQVTVHGTWPPGMPSGLEMIMQAWVVDPAAPQGFAASNAVASTTP